MSRRSLTFFFFATACVICIHSRTSLFVASFALRWFATWPISQPKFGTKAVCSSRLQTSTKSKVANNGAKSFSNRNNLDETSRANRNLSKDTFCELGGHDEDDQLISILHEHGFGPKLIKIEAQSLADHPLLAEIYANSQWQLVFITALIKPAIPGNGMPPLAEVITLTNGNVDTEITSIIDFGQITTVWHDSDQLTGEGKSIYESVALLKKLVADARVSSQRQFSVNHVEKSMQRLYNSFVGRKRDDASSLTKKNIANIAAKSLNASRVQDVMGKAIKLGGASMSRLIDSSSAAEYIYQGCAQDIPDAITRRIVSAEALSIDAALGGRFKRTPCVFVSAQNSFPGESGEDGRYNVVFLNGGWVAQDLSVCAGAEARKFAERTTFSGMETFVTKAPGQLLTAADERIATRLECLALGETLTEASRSGWREKKRKKWDTQEDTKLELDVREALKALNLTVSPEGAREALVKIGRWSQRTAKNVYGENTGKPLIEPWPKRVLDAARSLNQYEIYRRDLLFRRSSAGGQKSSCEIGTNTGLEGREDLTALPCVCIDAQRATFRDDAIGLRSRCATARKVVKDASKWEILIHIADVSDIFAPDVKTPLISDKSFDPVPLREAAESRGLSRYDLPLGPLHLMPPVALDALSLTTNKLRPGLVSSSSIEGSVNRCVTLWAYIDERSGKMIDAGLERTLVSSPVALSFDEASSLLETPADIELRPELLRTRLILSVLERNLSLWRKRQTETNMAAKSREARQRVKGLIAVETTPPQNARDDGREGSFQLTRGHKIIDAALELHGYALQGLLWRANRAPIPRSSGSGADRVGRLGTAPLRRYIDGMVQRQALAVLCGYGGAPLTSQHCETANKIADKATIKINNLRSTKSGTQGGGARINQVNQREALRTLAGHLNMAGGKNNRIVPAVSTGRENEVVILGIGALAKCSCVKGSLKPGQRIMVEVTSLNAEKGTLEVKFDTHS